MLQRFFYIVFFLLWLLAGLVAAEAGYRLFASWADKKAAALGQQYRNRAIDDEITYLKATEAKGPAPPAALRPPIDAPRRHDFLASEDDGFRWEYARTRGEWIAVFGLDGRLSKSYAPQHPEEMRAVADRAQIGDAIAQCLVSNEPAVAADLQRAVQAALGGAPQVRDYPLKLPDGAPYQVECSFLPVKDWDGVGDALLVFVKPSLFEIVWKKYRSHMYGGENFGHWIVWTNNVGFRDRDIDLPKPKGIYRIVCVGGSTTFEGPRNDLTYPKFLERMLQEYLTTDRIEVFCCGVYGLDSQGENARFPDYAALEPDFILHYNFANDAPHVMHQALSASLHPRLRRITDKSRLLRLFLSPLLVPPQECFVEIIRLHTLSRMAHFFQQAKDAGIAAGLCSFAYPHLETLPRDEQRFFRARAREILGLDAAIYMRAVKTYNALLPEFCAEQGILYVPVAENFNGGIAVFSDHCHLYLNGIKEKAHIIFEQIKDFVAEDISRKSAIKNTTRTE